MPLDLEERWMVVGKELVEIESTEHPGLKELVVRLEKGSMFAIVSMLGESTVVDFEHGSRVKFFAVAEAARLLAQCADTVGDLESQDDEPLGLTVDATDLMSDARLVFHESAERIMLVAYFCDELDFILAHRY